MVVGSNPASIELFHRFFYSKIGFVSAHLEKDFIGMKTLVKLSA